MFQTVIVATTAYPVESLIYSNYVMLWGALAKAGGATYLSGGELMKNTIKKIPYPP